MLLVIIICLQDHSFFNSLCHYYFFFFFGKSVVLFLINIFILSFYSSCFLFNCFLSFCCFMHCVHTNVITSQCWSYSKQFPSVELIRSSASISADHFCQHVVWFRHLSVFASLFFVAHCGWSVRADYQKQSSSHRMMVTFDKSDSASAKKKKKS